MNKAPYLRIHSQGLSGDAIATNIAADIEAGILPSGGRLPPVRVLAHQLGISKNTVQVAYDELKARDLIESRNRSGVFVKTTRHPQATTTSLEPKAPKLLKAPPLEARPDVEIDLGVVFIDRELLPLERLSTCYRSVIQAPGLSPFYDAQGYRPLREAIARRLKPRGIETSAAEIIITTGSQQALDLVCRALEHRTIATENPAYSIGKMLFEMNRMTITDLPLNPFEPIPMDLWEARIKANRPAILYLTTNYQNPTGYSYTTAELTRIAELSHTYGFGIIEDDWGSDMLSFSEYRPPLRALGGPSVLYMNSFTKKLMPSMRLGYLVAPPELVESLVQAKRAATLANPTLEEMALFEFLDRGYYDAHLKRLQAALDDRYHHCLETLDKLMPASVRWARPGGGPLIWLELPKNVNRNELAQRTLKRGVRIMVNANHFFGSPHLNGFPIGYAFPKKEELAKGLRILAEELATWPVTNG